LKNEKSELNLIFNNDRIGLSRDPEKPIATLEAEKLIEKELGTNAEDIYKIIVETIAIPNTTRVGARFDFWAAADSLEDADRFILRASRSDFGEFVCKSANSELYESSIHLRVEEP